MSFIALAWAAKQRPGNLAAKMVLLGLANYANEEGCAYPSTAALADFGDMDHKTATIALDRLIELGLIADSGERQGRTKQIKVYRLSLPETEAYQERKPSENGSHPDLLPKDPQKRGTDTVREPKPSGASAPKGKRAKPKFVLPSHLPADLWADFVEMRKLLGKPMSLKAKNLAVARLDKLADAGWPPGDVLSNSVLNSYQGLFPPKDDNQHGTRQPHPQPLNLRGVRPSPALEMYRRALADEAEERTGGDPQADLGAWPPLQAIGSG